VATVIYLDTHVVAWLYGLGPGSLTPKVAQLLGEADDRLIVAHASLFDAPLVSKDVTIHASYPHTIWD